MDLDYFHLLIFVIPFAVAYFFKAWFKRRSYLDYLIPSFIFFALGLRAVFHSLPQVFFSEDIAAFLNQTPNPFIKELGFANLGMGLAALIGFFYLSSRVLFFAALPYALYLTFSAVSHMLEIIDIRAFNLLALSDWIVVDLITPFTFFSLYFLRSRYE